MAQHDYVIANGTGAAVRSDLNNALAAIVSQNSGATAPSTTYAYMPWADSTTGLYKIRNAANNAWITLFQLDGEWSTLAVENGSAAAPSIYFKDSGTDTGIYSPGTDQVAISTGGTRRLNIDSSGNLVLDTGDATIYGVRVGRGNSARADNTAVGKNALNANTTGDYSVAVGSGALQSNQGGISNVAVGLSALGSNVSGNYNTGVGTEALSANTGSSNTCVGRTAGKALTTGSNNTIIGEIEGTAGLSGTVIIGAGSTERLRIDSSGRLLLGTSTTRSNFFNFSGISPALQLEGTSFQGRALSIVSSDNSSAPASAALILARQMSGSVGGNTIVSDGLSLGLLSYQGSDGTEFVEAARIEAFVDGTPGANDMPGRLVFSTTADGASNPTERMRIASDGFISINGDTNTGFSQPSGDVIAVTTGGTERLRIHADGSFSIATVDSTINSTADSRFVYNKSGGFFGIQNSGGIPLYINRNTNDGTLIEFRQDNAAEGTISVSGTTVSYNGAHLSRWSQLPGGAERIEILRGTVLSNIDEMCGWGEEENEQLNRMQVSDVEGDPNVSGVFQAWDDDDDTYTDDFYCAMTGDFIIRIAEGVTVQRGDLLMSAGDGTAKPQDDDIIRSKTIAKVTSTHVTCSYEDGSYCVPCVLTAC